MGQAQPQIIDSMAYTASACAQTVQPAVGQGRASQKFTHHPFIGSGKGLNAVSVPVIQTLAYGTAPRDITRARLVSNGTVHRDLRRLAFKGVGDVVDENAQQCSRTPSCRTRPGSRALLAARNRNHKDPRFLLFKGLSGGVGPPTPNRQNPTFLRSLLNKKWAIGWPDGWLWIDVPVVRRPTCNRIGRNGHYIEVVRLRSNVI